MSDKKCGCGISNKESSDSEVFEYYMKKDYEKLAFSNLKQPINSNGDTIIHVLARNLDKQAFETIRKYNPKAITYSVINTPNKLSELPIHHALESIKMNEQIGYDFIDYMVNELGASTNLPDINNRTVVNISKDTKVSYNTNDSINNLNDIVIRNIRKLSKIEDFNINTFIDQFISKQNVNRNVDFIKNITNHYSNLEQKGGYSKRRINSHFTDWKNSYDSFVVPNKNKILDTYIDDINNNIKMIDEWKKEKDRYKLEEERLKLEEEKTRNLRLFGGKNDDETREREIKLMERRKELMDEYNNTIGGKRIRKNNNDKPLVSKQNRKRNIKQTSNEMENLFSEDATTDTDLQRVNSIMKIDTDDDNKSSNIQHHITYGHHGSLTGNQERLRKRKFRRDPKLVEIYNSFVKKIMDFLDVDENTAKFYRSAIKINIENANPELRKWENDTLKMKEMEKIFENKEKLQEALDKIDMDQVKKFMEERKELFEKRREERRKEWEARKKEREEKKSKKDVTTEIEPKSDDKPNKKSTKKKSEPKTKKTKKNKEDETKQSRIVENGYIQSDEIIFSPSG
jgi:hypothetical protein